jgi:plastocyanin
MHNVVLSSAILAIALTACGGGNGGTDPPPTSVFTSLTVAPASPSLVEGDTVQLSATPRDQNGATMPGLPAATFALTSGTSVSVSATGRVVAVDPGGSTVTASLTSGGTTRTAASTPTVAALSNSADVTASGGGQTFTPDTVKIAVNGTVTWTFPGPNIHNVTFDSPQNASLNIDSRNSGSVARTFAAAGRHSYHCTLHAGMSGAVVVRTP